MSAARANQGWRARATAHFYSSPRTKVTLTIVATTVTSRDQTWSGANDKIAINDSPAPHQTIVFFRMSLQIRFISCGSMLWVRVRGRQDDRFLHRHGARYLLHAFDHAAMARTRACASAPTLANSISTRQRQCATADALCNRHTAEVGCARKHTPTEHRHSQLQMEEANDTGPLLTEKTHNAQT